MKEETYKTYYLTEEHINVSWFFVVLMKNEVLVSI